MGSFLAGKLFSRRQEGTSVYKKRPYLAAEQIQNQTDFRILKSDRLPGQAKTVLRVRYRLAAFNGHPCNEARACFASTAGAGVKAVQHTARQADIHALQRVIQHGRVNLYKCPQPALKFRMGRSAIHSGRAYQAAGDISIWP